MVSIIQPNLSPIPNLLGNQPTPLGQIPASSLLGRQTSAGLGQIPMDMGFGNVASGRALMSGMQQGQRPNFLGTLRGTASRLGAGLADPNMLRGIASGLLTGPSRTPVSFGQSLSQGLLMGQQMQEQERRKQLEEAFTAAKIREISMDAIGTPRPQDVVGFGYVVDEEGNPRSTYFDKRIRKTVFSDTQEPVGEAVIPLSAAELPNSKFFQTTREALTAEEKALDSMDKYLVGLQNDPKGMERFFNKVSQAITTAFDGTPTKDEMARAINEGRLQGLIGQVREDVVGPGVMTEFDAVRILMSLGGNYGVFQSPEAAIQLISEVRERKYSGYQELLGEYNRARDTLPSGSALKTIYEPRSAYQLTIMPPSSWFAGGGTLEGWKGLSEEEKSEFVGG